MNPLCVGQPPAKIAHMAGFEVPPETSILCCELTGVGKQHPLSAEKLSPVLSLYFVADFNAAQEHLLRLLKFGGAGHTACIYSKNDARTREYALRMPANRILVNTPSPQGSTGITTNIYPSMTLGCGAVAGNSTSDNVGPLHLINIKRLAYVVRKPEEAFEMPLDYHAAPVAPAAAAGSIDRATVVSAVERYLASRGIAVAASAAAPACSCSQPAEPAGQAKPVAARHHSAVLSSVAADVVDKSSTRARAATVDWPHRSRQRPPYRKRPGPDPRPPAPVSISSAKPTSARRSAKAGRFISGRRQL